MAAFVEGNDDTFAVMMFGFFAFICCMLIVEPLVRRKAYVSEVMNTLNWWKSVVKLLTTEPNKAHVGVSMMRENTEYFKTFVLPYWKVVFGKWRWACWFLMIFLFTIVAYQKLTFDPYAILQIRQNAETSEIKKAFRQLSMRLHPDKNKTEAARIEYAAVKKAHHFLTKPEDRESLLEDTTDQQVGMAMPRWMTNPNNAPMAMTVLLLLLFSVPLTMLFWLNNKGNKNNFIPFMIRLAKYIDMAEPFLERMGQPVAPEVLFERAERPKLVELLKKLEAESIFETSAEEIPIKPSEVAAHFHPEITSSTELRTLLRDAVSESKTASLSGIRLQKELGAFVNKYYQHRVEDLVSEPTEEEMKALEDYQQCIKVRQSAKARDDIEYKRPTDDEWQVAVYFLNSLLFDVINMAFQLLPKSEPKSPDFALKLRNLYTSRISHLELLRKHADERGDSPPTKVHREQMARACELAASSEKASNDILAEMRSRCRASQRKWRQDYEKSMKAAGKKSKKN